MKLKVFEAFAGYGSQAMALNRLRENYHQFDYEVVGISEIDKLLNAGISNSQLYKLAGNSIVCSVIYHVMRKMFIEKENENQQLTLF